MLFKNTGAQAPVHTATQVWHGRLAAGLLNRCALLDSCLRLPVVKLLCFGAHLASGSGFPEVGVDSALGSGDAPLRLRRCSGAHATHNLWQASSGGAEGQAGDTGTAGDETVGRRKHFGQGVAEKVFWMRD